MQDHVTTAYFAVDGDIAEGEIYTIATRAIVTDWARIEDPSPRNLDHPITRGTATGSPAPTTPPTPSPRC